MDLVELHRQKFLPKAGDRYIFKGPYGTTVTVRELTEEDTVKYVPDNSYGFYEVSLSYFLAVLDKEVQSGSR